MPLPALPFAVPAALRRGARLAGRGATALLDSVLPPSCPTCDARTDVQGALCAACFRRAGFLSPPLCRSCGAPFGSADAAGHRATCLSCDLDPPPWTEARAALLYDDWSRLLVLPLKYSDRTEHAGILARHMLRIGAPLVEAADLLVPVPLHRTRLRQRRYNQAALLARAVARAAGRPCCPDALRRLRATPRLASLSPDLRRAAMAGAIGLRPSRVGLVRGRRILLVDDILTTGTTLRRCAETLLAAGAVRVDVLVAARTEQPRDDPGPARGPDGDLPFHLAA